MAEGKKRKEEKKKKKGREGGDVVVYYTLRFSIFLLLDPSVRSTAD